MAIETTWWGTKTERYRKGKRKEYDGYRKPKPNPPVETAGWFSFQDFVSNNSLPAFHIYLPLFSLSSAPLSLSRKTFLIHLAH